jgi:hypothetical protein
VGGPNLLNPQKCRKTRVDNNNKNSYNGNNSILYYQCAASTAKKANYRCSTMEDKIINITK